MSSRNNIFMVCCNKVSSDPPSDQTLRSEALDSKTKKPSNNRSQKRLLVKHVRCVNPSLYFYYSLLSILQVASNAYVSNLGNRSH